MNGPRIETARLCLISRSRDEALAEVAGLDPAQRAHVSPAWLARAQAPEADFWTLGFRLRLRATGAEIGSFGFKAPADAEGAVEIAYMVEPAHQGRDYATEAAAALTDFALRQPGVRVVRAHTLPLHNASARVLAKCGFEHLGGTLDPEDGLVWRWEKRAIFKVLPESIASGGT